MSADSSRRDLLKKMAGVGAAVVLAPAFIENVMAADKKADAKAGKKACGAEPAVDPKEAAAVPLKYVENSTDVKDKALMIERQGTKWGDQYCWNCTLFLGKKCDIGGKAHGACGVFPGKVVSSGGWCTTWNLKAGAKPV